MPSPSPPRTFRHRTRKLCKGVGGNRVFNARYNTVPVRGQQLSREQTVRAPRIILQSDNNMYTLVMYDADAPNPAYVHWYIPNILHGKLRPALAYQPPNPPPSDTHYHVYAIDLYRQVHAVDVTPIARSRFNADVFVQQHALKLVKRMQFYIDPRTNI
jgi:phosphatidylethanolamine-binding protein (PEBP) family uncharacterized protein